MIAVLYHSIKMELAIRYVAWKGVREMVQLHKAVSRG